MTKIDEFNSEITFNILNKIFLPKKELVSDRHAVYEAAKMEIEAVFEHHVVNHSIREWKNKDGYTTNHIEGLWVNF